MTRPLNITKQEAECLYRVCSRHLTNMTGSSEYICKPFMEHLVEKLLAMKFPEQKFTPHSSKQKLKSA